MKNHLQILGILIIILCSCGNMTEKEIEIRNGLILSKRFEKAENQDGKFVDFLFEIDSTKKLIVDKIDFYKLNLKTYDSIYIGKRNDTVFSYDRSIQFKDIFLILNNENKRSLGRLGNDYRVFLKNTNGSIFDFTFVKIQNTTEGDHILMGYDYPPIVVSQMKINRNGIIMDIKVEQNTK